MSGLCPNCNKPLGDGQIYCGNCGTRMGGTVESQAYAPPQPTAQPQMQYAQGPYYPKPRKKGTLIIILSVVFLVLAGAVLALIFLLGPYNAKPEELKGNWDCVLKVEKISNEDTSYISKDDLGDEKDAQMMLNLDKNGVGTMNISGITFDAVYKSGKITAKSMLDDQLEFTLDGSLKKDKDEYTLTGVWKYAIVKGKDKGDVANGSWIAVQSASVEPTTPAGITAADLEGTWKGDLVFEELPGMDANANIPEADKAIMREQIGTKSAKVFIFKNGKLWVGEESDAASIAAADMGTVTINGTTFTASVVTAIGNSDVTGDLVNEGGKTLIKCTVIFPEIPAANSETETVTILASFVGEKQ